MRKAVIIGVYEFLGIHFCKKILEKGIPVNGIHAASEENELFLEEKKMEIGRNSNFAEITFERLDDAEDTCIVIDFYVFFMKESSKEFCRFVAPYLDKVKKSKIVLLLPLSGKREPFVEELKWVCLLEKQNVRLLSFFLPAVYGPWQPGKMVFQQIFLKEMEKIERVAVSEREWIFDALFVEDAVECMLEHLPAEGEFFLTSGKENRWALCAKSLSFSLAGGAQYPDVPDIHPIVVHSKTPLQEGLEKQKRHLWFLSCL